MIRLARPEEAPLLRALAERAYAPWVPVEHADHLLLDNVAVEPARRGKGRTPCVKSTQASVPKAMNLSPAA